MRLTDLAIRNLSLPENGQKTHFDDALPGFGVRVSQRSKSFVVMFGSRRRLKTLGRWPQKSLADARKDAVRYLALSNSQSASKLYSDAVEAFLEECTEKNRPNTVREYRRFLNRLDFKGNVDEITRHTLKPHIASPHSLVAFKIFLNWCVKSDLTGRNPLAGDTPSYGPAKSRVLTPEELKAVWSYEDPPFSDIVKLLIIMGQRRTETSLIVAEWIKDTCVHFPANITKNGKDHVMPFGDLAGRYLPPKAFNSWSKAKEKMDKVVQIDPWTLHDLRRTFSTIHAQIGTPIHVTERMLNHVSGTVSGVASIYNRHSYLEEMRQAVAAYDAHLQKLLNL